MTTFADRDDRIQGGPHDGRDPVTLAHYLMTLRYDPNLTERDDLMARIELAYPNLDEKVLGQACELLSGKRVDRWGHA
jgi:hypothetical protein